MSTDTDPERSGGLYERRIGKPTTDDEVNGYWLFAFGVLLGLLGVVVFLFTERATTARGVGYALAALAPPFIMLGAVIRFPLRRTGTTLGYLGAVLSFVAVVWFVSIFPGGWSTASGELGVIGLYAAGLALVGLAGAVVPLLSDPVHEEYERMQTEAAATAAERDSTAAELESTREELAAARADAADAAERADDLEAEADAARAETAALRESKARFELFEDAGGKPRWRLRHDNGNIIGDSGEGYASKSNAKRALGRVREHVAAADYLRVDPAAFEVYQDAGGGWRWRLIHENGNILADSGEAYSSRSKARQGLDSVRSNVGDAPVDDLDAGDDADGGGSVGATFELYEDTGGEYRWRLRHRNGNIIADSGEGYASKSGAKDAIERVREYGPAADVLEVGNAAFEIYEDAADEWRWRLRHRNGNVIADSGEGYASRSNAVEAVTGVKENAPGAGEETVA